MIVIYNSKPSKHDTPYTNTVPILTRSQRICINTDPAPANKQTIPYNKPF